MPNITIASYEDAFDLLAESPSNFAHVISINDPKLAPPRTLHGHKARKLLLNFFDELEPSQLCPRVPTRDDVKQILHFAGDIQKGDKCLVHCMAGISRSSGAALAILASKVKPTRHGAAIALRQLLDAKQEISPNATMVKHIDELLGFNGELIRQHGRIFPGDYTVILPLETLDDLMRQSGLDI